MFLQDFAQSCSRIAGNRAGQAFERTHGVINSTAQIRFRSPGKRLQRFMDFPAGARAAGFFKRCLGRFDGRFKPISTATSLMSLGARPKSWAVSKTQCRRFSDASSQMLVSFARPSYP